MLRPSRETLRCVHFGALSIACAISAVARAHVEGHGEALHGKGPGGGRIVSVISASQADAGKNAEQKAVAEIFRKGKQIEVQLWDKSMKKKMAVPAGAEVKWIFLGGALEKPVVLKEANKSPLLISSENLEKAESVEVILPEAGDLKEKLVFVCPLKEN